jgi:hypothetical protein
MNKQTIKQTMTTPLEPAAIIKQTMTTPLEPAAIGRGVKSVARAALVIPAHTSGRNNTGLEKYLGCGHFGRL